MNRIFLRVCSMLAMVLLTAAYARGLSIGQFEYEFVSPTEPEARICGPARGTTLSGDVVIPATVVNPIDGLTYTVNEIGHAGGNLRDEDTGRSAFHDQTEITSLTIPATITYIWDDSFSGCSAIKEFRVDTANKAYISVDGVLFSKSSHGAMDELLRFPPAKKVSTYTIPDATDKMDFGSRFVRTGAFRDNSSIKTLVIGKEVIFQEGVLSGNLGISKIVGSDLWSINKNGMLVSEDGKTLRHMPPAYVTGTILKIPAGITAIGPFGCASARCNGIDFNNVTVLGHHALAESALESVVVPETVTEMGSAVFSGCGKLVTARFENRIKVIEASTFSDCVKLQTIEYPSSCRGVYPKAFYNCQSLTAFSLANMTTLGMEGYYLSSHFAKSGITKVNWPSKITEIPDMMYLKCKDLVSLSLKPTTERICDMAFYGTSLETLNTASLKVIEDYVFEDCDNLRKIVFPDSGHELTLGKNSFQINKDAEIYIDHTQLHYGGWDGGDDWTDAFYGYLGEARFFSSLLDPGASWFTYWKELYCPGGSSANYEPFRRMGDIHEMFSYRPDFAGGAVHIEPAYPWVKITGVTIDGAEAAVTDGTVWKGKLKSNSAVMVDYTANGVHLSTLYPSSYQSGTDNTPSVLSGGVPRIRLESTSLIIEGESPVTYTVVSPAGKLLLTGALPAAGGPQIVSLAGLAPGCYIATATGKDGSASIKINL